MKTRTNEEKYQTVIQRNSFYFSDRNFEELYEGRVNAIKESLLVLHNEITNRGVHKEIFVEFLTQTYGLSALLALTGFSNESLKRLITLIRIVDNSELNRLTLKANWCDPLDNNNVVEDIKEWGDATIEKMIQTNPSFRLGLINVFFEGATTQFLNQTLPIFELKKLSISKMKFDLPALIDTVIRYKEKGSYSGKAKNNPETIIIDILNSLDVKFESGDLSKLVTNALATKRRMDFIIPNQHSPLLIVESSFLVTTSSGQGDKSKTEIGVRELLKQHYPQAMFVGFVDGIGWYVRQADLRRMVGAYDDVFTFHPDELERFRRLVMRIV